MFLILLLLLASCSYPEFIGHRDKPSSSSESRKAHPQSGQSAGPSAAAQPDAAGAPANEGAANGGTANSAAANGAAANDGAANQSEANDDAVSTNADAPSNEPSGKQLTEKETAYLIVPGQSVGKIKLGMSKDDVVSLLGKAAREMDQTLTYYSKNKQNYISVHWDKESGEVCQIDFTSSAFSTEDGVTTANFEDSKYEDAFNHYEFQWRFLNERYEWKDGGLAFFAFNADVPDDNPEYSRYVRGYVYEGDTLPDEPIGNAEWKPAP